MWVAGQRRRGQPGGMGFPRWRPEEPHLHPRGRAGALLREAAPLLLGHGGDPFGGKEGAEGGGSVPRA
eukprot:12533204-Prorocentrum_lima.AAC.1